MSYKVYDPSSKEIIDVLDFDEIAFIRKGGTITIVDATHIGELPQIEEIVRNPDGTKLFLDNGDQVEITGAGPHIHTKAEDINSEPPAPAPETQQPAPAAPAPPNELQQKALGEQSAPAGTSPYGAPGMPPAPPAEQPAPTPPAPAPSAPANDTPPAPAQPDPTPAPAPAPAPSSDPAPAQPAPETQQPAS